MGGVRGEQGGGGEIERPPEPLRESNRAAPVREGERTSASARDAESAAEREREGARARKRER